MWLGHVAGLGNDRRAKQVMNWASEKEGLGKTEEKLVKDHQRRPARI